MSEKKTWKGVSVEFTGRPGIICSINKKGKPPTD
jgi:hypothetical protein